MSLEGLVKVHLNNGKVKEYLTNKETFVAFDSFLKKPEEERKGKVKLGNDIILTKDIGYIEWHEEGADE